MTQLRAWTLLTLLIFYLQGALCSSPRQMTWSNRKFGPDGPWQAVVVSMGSNHSDLVLPSSQVALYPGGTWESKILLSSLCDNTTVSSICYSDKTDRYFNSNISVTFDDNSIESPPHGTWEDIQWGATNAVRVFAKARRARDWMTIDGDHVPDVDLITISAGWQTWPGGKTQPMELGTLSLGSPDINQTFGASIKINTTFITSYLYEHGGSKAIPSYSYGMHIGSAALGIPGSLLLGGYDKKRVIGYVSAQPFSSEGNFPIDMQDISIGVAKGGSPFSFPNKHGLLAQGNSSLSSGLTILIDPTSPYIYLPQSSCDAIASTLPVTYQPLYGLYFWNTSSPQYEKIITSPSYLAFTFSKNGLNNANITIKAPFSLLNLTLDTPLVDTPTPYFPCMPTNSTALLGRAFLQAAFIGVNWLGKPGNWFLAQAPGPDNSFIDNSVPISIDARALSGSSDSWEATWKNQWVALPGTSSDEDSDEDQNTPASTVAGRSGLSAAAKAGIAVGAVVGGILVLALPCGLYIRRRRLQQQNLSGQDITPQVNPGNQSTPVEVPDTAGNNNRILLDSQPRYEIGSEGDRVYGLRHEKGPVVGELGHDGQAEKSPRSRSPVELP